jgi:hypothetical protein
MSGSCTRHSLDFTLVTLDCRSSLAEDEDLTETSEEDVTDVDIAYMLDEATRLEIRPPVEDDQSEPAPVLVCSPQMSASS